MYQWVIYRLAALLTKKLKRILRDQPNIKQKVVRLSPKWPGRGARLLFLCTSRSRSPTHRLVSRRYFAGPSALVLRRQTTFILERALVPPQYKETNGLAM